MPQVIGARHALPNPRLYRRDLNTYGRCLRPFILHRTGWHDKSSQALRGELQRRSYRGSREENGLVELSKWAMINKPPTDVDPRVDDPKPPVRLDQRVGWLDGVYRGPMVGRE